MENCLFVNVFCRGTIEDGSAATRVHLHYNYRFSNQQPSQDMVCHSATERLPPHHPRPVSTETNVIQCYSEQWGL